MEDAEGNEQVEHLLRYRKGSVTSFGEKIKLKVEMNWRMKKLFILHMNSHM